MNTLVLKLRRLRKLLAVEILILLSATSTLLGSTFVDVNGDGKGDLLQQWNNNGVLYLLPYASNGMGFAPTNWVNTGQGYASGPRNGPGLIAADVNGDGHTDFIQQWNNNGVLWLLIYYSDGAGGLTWQNWINTQTPYATGPEGTPGLMALDVNGDGKTDLVQQWNNYGVLYLKVYLSNGSGFTVGQWVSTNQGFSSTYDGTPGLIAADVNGDGKTDLVQQWDYYGTLYLLPYLSNGAGFVPTNWVNTGQGYASADFGNPGLIALDVNGDGKTDLVQQWKYHDPTYGDILQLMPYLSTCTGVSNCSFTGAGWYNTGQGYWSGPGGTPGLLALDVNGDGKTDLVQQWRYHDPTYGDILWLMPYLSACTDASNCSFVEAGWYNTGQGYWTGPGGTPGLRALDVNGDGKTDLVHQWNNNGVLWLMPYLSYCSDTYTCTFLEAGWVNTYQGYNSAASGTPGLVAGNYLNPVSDPVSAHAVGGVETVYQHNSNRCGPGGTMDAAIIPDTPTRAFRDANGRIQLLISDATDNHRMVGTVNGPLSSVALDCNVLMATAPTSIRQNPDNHQDGEWIHGGPYTLDGWNIYALIHNEYAGWNYYPQYCDHNQPLQSLDTCWKTSTTLVVSNDEGASYSHPATYAVAWPAYPYNMFNQDIGLSAPSNIISGNDGYYYAAVSAWWAASQSSPVQSPGICMIRTNNLSDATSWRAYNNTDGTGQNFFDTAFYDANGGPTGATCAPISRGTEGTIPPGSYLGQIVYSTFFNKYLLLMSGDPAPTFQLSDDLVHWGPARRIEGLPAPGGSAAYAYGTILDDNDPSLNFERPGRYVYLYLTRFNNGTSYDRDLVRIPIAFDNMQ